MCPPYRCQTAHWLATSVMPRPTQKKAPWPRGLVPNVPPHLSTNKPCETQPAYARFHRRAQRPRRNPQPFQASSTWARPNSRHQFCLFRKNRSTDGGTLSNLLILCRRIAWLRIFCKTVSFTTKATKTTKLLERILSDLRGFKPYACLA